MVARGRWLDEVLEKHQSARVQGTQLSPRARLPRPLISLLAVALLALLAVEAPSASLRILWRFAVLSYDHPTTQVLDEMACAPSAASAVGAEARQFTRLLPCGRFVPAGEPSRLVASALFSGITRSPPAR
jgi:hypothetical protein